MHILLVWPGPVTTKKKQEKTHTWYDGSMGGYCNYVSSVEKPDLSAKKVFGQMEICRCYRRTV